MIFGNTGIFFNLLSIMALSVLLIILALTVIIKLKPAYINQYSVLSRRKLLWFVAIAPWFVSLLAAILAIISGTQFSPFPQGFDLLHWHHSQEFIFLSWHGFSMLLAMTYVGFILFKKIFLLVKNNNQLKLLHGLSLMDKDGFYQLDTHTISAFTAGYLKPRCYITSSLRQQLNKQEYQIVQLHEKAHANSSDPFKKWLFQLLMAFFPKSIAKQLNQSMSLTMEQCADTAVTQVIHDRSLIAMTLLKVRRLTAKAFDHSLHSNAVCHYSFDNIEARISYLLSEQKLRAFPFLTCFISVATMSVLSALSADIFHHLIEYTLSH